MGGWGRCVGVAGPAATGRVTEAQGASFRQVGGREHAERAVEVAGWPQEVRLPTAPIGRAVELSLGGHLIGPRADSQSFLLAPPVLAEWERSGGASGRLGLPMTNAYVFDGSLRQEFEHGHLRLSPDPSVALAQLDPATIELHLVVEPGAALQDLDLKDRKSTRLNSSH